MAQINWTDEQKDVINSLDNNTLVSASAGSGKTAVMLERLMRIIVGDRQQGRAGVPLKNIVTVTFNESVACELRSKIASELVKLINTGVADNDYLRAQIEDIPLADISTLHAFCSNLIKTNFEQLDIDPSFSIADDSEREVLFQKAVDEVMKKYKSGYDYEIDMLIGYCKSESKLYENIAKIYTFLEAQPDRQKYLDEIAVQNYKGNFKDTLLAKRYLASVSERSLEYLIEGNKKRGEYDFANAQKFVEHIDIHLAMLDKINSAKDIEQLCQTVNNLQQKIPNRPSAGKKDDAVLQEIAKEYEVFNEKCKSLYAELRDIFDRPFSEITSTLDKDAKYLFRITEIVREVAQEYAKLKKKENKFDFSDLEYYAVKLLQDDKIAEELSQRYKYICVDEYQDINAVQEYIITRLSDGKNLFMVGDVKQSIYQFRMTDPEIFLSKYKRYRENGDEGNPFSLNSNYRSCIEVVDFVNKIFDVIMTEKCGGIDYKKDSRLVRGNTDYDPQSDSPVRIATFAKSKAELVVPVGEDGVYSVKDSLSEQTEQEYEEGVYIAKEILNLVQSGTIQDVKSEDKHKRRKIKFSDIAILSATRSGGVEKIIRVLKSVGIPVDANNVLKEKSNPSIELIADLLRVIDNHRNDIPLVSVLTSIFGGLTNGMLAEIKKQYSVEKFFHKAAIRYSREKRDDIAKKLRVFFDMLEKYRFAGGFMSVSELIRRILADFDYSTYLHTLEDGQAEYVGLEQFVGTLSEKSYNSSVAKFVKAMESVKEFGKVSGNTGMQGDYVRTSTIHSSKGLEYPVVFIADCAKEINMGDATQSLISCDKRYGMAIRSLNEKDREYDDSLPMLFLKQVKSKEILEEYMRLFYVAVTRAKNRLYLTATASDGFAEKYIKNPKSMWAWLNNVAYTDEKFKEQYAVSVESAEQEELEEATSVYTYRRPSEQALKQLTDYFDKPYAYAEATVTPVKYTVTALNNIAYESKTEKKDKEKTVNYKNLIEDFVEEMREDGEYDSDIRLYADEGIAYHRVMECIDFDCYTVKDVQNSIDGMVEKRLLTPEQRDFVNPALILDCLDNPVISLARKHTHYREKQFMLNLPADEITDTSLKDTVLLQGTVDLFIAGREKGEQNVLVDFKFSKKSDEEIKKRYSKQLELYTMAIEECMNTKVDRKVIYVLGKNKVIEM